MATGWDTHGRRWLGELEQFFDLLDCLSDRRFQFGSEFDRFDTTLLGIAEFATDVETGLAESEEIIAELEALSVLGTGRALDFSDYQCFVLIGVSWSATKDIDLHPGQCQFLPLAHIGSFGEQPPQREQLVVMVALDRVPGEPDLPIADTDIGHERASDKLLT